MPTLDLTGLKGTEPVGFLAALGLFRVLTCRGTFGAVKLGWSDEPEVAVLHAERECDVDRLVKELLEHMRGRAELAAFLGRGPDREPVGGTDWKDIKVDPGLFRDWLIATRRGADQNGREVSDFLSAFGCELVVARSTGDLKPTAFHSTAARQQFLQLCRNLANSLDTSTKQPRRLKSPEVAFKEALFGPWEYADECHSLGFDPNTEAVYALAASAPTDEKPVCTRAAVWLAIEAVPLFPVLPIRGRLETRGFTRRQDLTVFRWPIWDTALGLNAVHTALGLPEVAREPTPERLKEWRTRLTALGVRAVMESERVSVGQGFGQLRPAARVG